MVNRKTGWVNINGFQIFSFLDIYIELKYNVNKGTELLKHQYKYYEYTKNILYEINKKEMDGSQKIILKSLMDKY